MVRGFAYKINFFNTFASFQLKQCTFSRFFVFCYIAPFLQFVKINLTHVQRQEFCYFFCTFFFSNFRFSVFLCKLICIRVKLYQKGFGCRQREFEILFEKLCWLLIVWILSALNDYITYSDVIIILCCILP